MQPGQTMSSSKKKNKKKKNKGAHATHGAPLQAGSMTVDTAEPARHISGAAPAGVKAGMHPQQVGEAESDNEEAPELGNVEDFHPASSSQTAPPPSLAPATQAELLATANELYRQIEAAAAAALASTGGNTGGQSGGPPNSNQANGKGSIRNGKGQSVYW